MLRVGKKSKRLKSKIRPVPDLLQRTDALWFLLLTTVGVILGSYYTAKGEENQYFLVALTINSIEKRCRLSFSGLLFQILSGRLIIIVYLYFVLHCTKGKLLLGIVGSMIGITTGSTISAIIIKWGYQAFLPATVVLLPAKLLEWGVFCLLYEKISLIIEWESRGERILSSRKILIFFALSMLILSIFEAFWTFCFYPILLN